MFIMSAKKREILDVNYSEKIVPYTDFIDAFGVYEGEESGEPSNPTDCVEGPDLGTLMELVPTEFGKIPEFSYRPPDFNFLGGLHWELVFRIFDRGGMGGDMCAAVEDIANGGDGFDAWGSDISKALPMGDKVIEHGKDINKIKGELVQINQDMDKLEGQVGGIAGEINNINDKLDGLEGGDP